MRPPTIPRIKSEELPICPVCQSTVKAPPDICLACGRDYTKGFDPDPAKHINYRITHRLIDCWCEPILEDVRSADGSVRKTFRHQGSVGRK